MLTALVAAVSPAWAFTNGTLVPAYICNPTPDGMPKSFGQLLTYTREPVGPMSFNTNVTSNLLNPPQYVPTNNNSLVMNSAFILASFHNSLNTIEAIHQGAAVMVPNNTLVAGTTVELLLSSGTTGVNLDGLLIYAQDMMGVRQGSFVDRGGVFVPFAGCGKNPQGEWAGMIQEVVVSNSATYNMLSYKVPACVPSGKLTMAGLSVTDSGFGVWNYTLPVVGSKCSTMTTSSTTSTTTTTPSISALDRFLGILFGILAADLDHSS